MIVVVADANILIDLLIIEMIDEFFKLDFDFHTTNLIMGEIKEPRNETFYKHTESQKLAIMNFSSVELDEIYKLNLEFPFLSIPDCSCIRACQKTNAILLTGEKRLRKIVKEKGIEAHGIIWVFDELLSQKVVNSDLAIEKLNDLKALNPRLPEVEFKRFICNIRNLK